MRLWLLDSLPPGGLWRKIVGRAGSASTAQAVTNVLPKAKGQKWSGWAAPYNIGPIDMETIVLLGIWYLLFTGSNNTDPDSHVVFYGRVHVEQGR